MKRPKPVPVPADEPERITRTRWVTLIARLAQYNAPEQHILPELHAMKQEAQAIVRELTRPAATPADVAGRIGGAR